MAEQMAANPHQTRLIVTARLLGELTAQQRQMVQLLRSLRIGPTNSNGGHQPTPPGQPPGTVRLARGRKQERRAPAASPRYRFPTPPSGTTTTLRSSNAVWRTFRINERTQRTGTHSNNRHHGP